MFINDDVVCSVTLYIANFENNLFIGRSPIGLKHSIDTYYNLLYRVDYDGEIDKVYEFEYVFKMPSYKDAVDFNSSYEMLDINTYRMKMLVEFLTSWNMTDFQGNSVELNEDSIGKLHPKIAYELINFISDIIR